ncbi:hypothetical protein Egran_01045 [Elaphomyces granulatus]|uniref:Zn(2)-C6 fungal-type domain-containing protein n=1 Tax=Elaphomyces granulatus TaxID=519963 RepID=A0A232M4A1_9EURO|nr:hypothetical protein Egran_01045 [Elaphomyces granulatus]
MQSAQAGQHQQPREAEGYTAPPDHHAGRNGQHVGNSIPEQQSPGNPVPKNVAFELLLDENSKVRARIPMRVQIFPHDTTDSIVTTVKNFYGIYEGAASGVSFEDELGTTLIARYENLRNNMTVYVRVIPVHTYGDGYGEHHYYGSASGDARKRPSLGEPFQMIVSQSAHMLDYTRPPSRPTSRVARKRSTSPPGRGGRSASQHKGLPRNGNKSRGSSAHGSFHDDGMTGYSDSDGGHGSITGSKKARSDQFASSEISMDNILQDGRRKRPKFESSELPLFVPPQVPLTTSTSSISPQRRSTVQEGEPSPFARPAQRPYIAQPLPSPQSYGYNEQAYGANSTRLPLYKTPGFPEHGHRLRERPVTQSSAHSYNASNRPGGILPTPDPTIASCISDEDVAMQLIRLGDASNFSHGRNSASTLDDAFSGAADASSSTGATSDGGEFSDDDDGELPPRSKPKLEPSPMLPPGAVKRVHRQFDDVPASYDGTELSGNEGDESYCQEEGNVGLIKNEPFEDAADEDSIPKTKKLKTKAASSVSSKPQGPKIASSNPAKSNRSRSTPAPRKPKASTVVTTGSHKMLAPNNVINPPNSRKASGSAVQFQHQLAADEEDLSTKPRCQRCRKSKKGCDRQRPCGRCRDAGIGVEGCVSEDEGNGRKGRYGRHMGVPVKKVVEAAPMANHIQPIGSAFAPAIPVAMTFIEKNKKRKR